jgi:hypothetical protein
MGFAFHRLVLKLSAFKKRRMQKISEKPCYDSKGSEAKAYIRKYKSGLGHFRKKAFSLRFWSYIFWQLVTTRL